MKLLISIEMNNDAFQPSDPELPAETKAEAMGAEVARILRLYADGCDTFAGARIHETLMFDINGNTVGGACIVEVE